jgi:electron transfer flavoprotein beta subunit
MKAKKKPIEKFTPSDLGVDLTPRLETLKISEPAKRQGGGKVRSSHYTTHTPLTILPSD